MSFVLRPFPVQCAMTCNAEHAIDAPIRATGHDIV
jgi:hypothetical protein